MLETARDYLTRRISPGETLEQIVAFPRFFEIETVNACNAKCPMCTIADWNRRDGVMKDDLFEKIATELEGHPEVRRVHLYRDGEPLLDKKLPRRIRRMKDAGVREVGISTNAQLLNEERARAILESGLDEIILSVDSVREATYQKIRVGLDFHTVFENSKKLFAYRDELKSECKIRVRMIRQKSNAQEWDSGEFQGHFTDKAGPRDSIEYRDIHNWGGQISGHSFRGDTGKPCIALWSLMVIFADGSVPLCNVDYNNHFPLGNVRESSIAELWQSAEQNRRRENHRHAIAPCAGCTVWSESAKTVN